MKDIHLYVIKMAIVSKFDKILKWYSKAQNIFGTMEPEKIEY